MKKKGIIAAVIILIGLSVGIFMMHSQNYAEEAQFSITVENASVQKEDTFTLHVKVDSNVPIGKLESYITYDANILEFVSSESESINGSSGTLYLKEEAGQGAKSLEYEITMKALEVGKANFTVGDVVIEDYSTGDTVLVKETKSSSTTVKVNVNNELSGEAKLDQLLIFPGELTPSFSSDIYEYSVEVDSDVTELMITAEPLEEEASVTVTKDDQLSYGNNEITITVTAPSGKSRDYILNVYRNK